MTNSRKPPEVVTATTHDFGSALLRRPDVRVRAFLWGRLVIIWDSKQHIEKGFA